ncbi:MAG: AMP-binding protein [Calditrichia bacterium]
MPKTGNKTKSFPFNQQIVWEPNPEWIAESNLQRFMNKHGIPDYDTLMIRSVEEIAWFWESVLEDLDIQFFRPYPTVVDLQDGIQFPRWCVGGRMNIIHNCLDKWQQTSRKHQPALRWENEEGHVRTMTYAQLHQEVNRCTNALKQLGLGKGDVVGLYMPMIPELVIAFLAIIKIGGIVLPLFSGYGASALAMRLKDAEARALFCADGMIRRGKSIPMKPVCDEALKQVPSVEIVVTVQHGGIKNTPWNSERDWWWHQLIPGQSAEAQTVSMSAEDVLMLIYTSGTTGKPKGAVHTHCGFPIKAAMDMFYPMDLKPGQVMYWMTDMGWMMGPWEVFGTLLIGATMVLYDGAPDYPHPQRVWDMVATHRVTHLGLTPSFIRAIMSANPEAVRNRDFPTLRMVGSTGSPWDPESWMWLFENVLDRKKPIMNYSGGTEISGGILCGNLFKPLKPCAFSGPVLGMAADVLDEAGNPVRGAVGELVIRQPWMGMTRGFWKDTRRYQDTYWSRFPGIWQHGDYAAIDEEGLWYILGRSDDTINVAGKRLGPAEVESIVNSHPAVSESAAIAVPHPVKDNEVVIFCVLQKHATPDETLRQELIQWVTRELGKPLKPREIKFTTVLPKTRNAKVMHRIIRATYLREEAGDLSSLEDPRAVEAIRNAI